MRHGEAISIGLVFAAQLAGVKGLLDEETIALHTRILSSIGLPTTYPREAWQQLYPLLALDKKPTRETAMPKVFVEEDDSELIQNQEYLIFRGIVAKNPNGSDDDILTEWMAVLGKQRVTDKLREKFWEYWEEAKRTL